MCGIVGMFSAKSTIEKTSLQQSIKSINHRGPDSQNIWLAANKKSGLAHTRLSIIDLQTGDQPISNEENNIHIVVNGEFYEFEKQRAQLMKEGHHFKTLTDSEIALHLYENFGPDCLKHLRGEFAFILWDEKQQTCFAARDRFGIKPLFYSFVNDTLYLASEIKALLAAGIKPEWDHEAMRLYLDSTLNHSSQTPFKNIYQIPPGFFLLFKKNNLQLLQYWDWNYPKEDALLPALTEEDYVAGLQAKLDEAIRIRLRADVPVGCYLSGGLDSSAVLGMAATHAQKPISAFTLSFDREEYDEYAMAREMAEKVGAQFHPIVIKQADLANHFADAIWHAESFCYNGHGIAKFLLSKAVKQAGYKVVLTGEGADEILAGYPHFRLDQLLYGQKNQSVVERKNKLAQLKKSNEISLGLLLPSEDDYRIKSVEKLLGFTPSWLLVGKQAGKTLSAVAAENFATPVDSLPILLNNFAISAQLTQREPVNQSLYLWSKLRLANYVLVTLGDRMEMAHSIEGRLPFLDHHVVEFMRDVPVQWKIHNMAEKYLLRQAARSHITKTIFKREKQPFLAPPALLDAQGALHELMQTTLRGPALAATPFFERKKVIGLLDKLPHLKKEESVALDPILMIILSMCVLQEKFGLV